MDPEYGKAYRRLYEQHWWWRAREAALLDTIRKVCSGGRRRHILDVGCGDGLFFEKLLEFGDVEGVEPDGSLVSDDGPYRSHIHIRPFDDRYLPGHRYDLILMLDVLEHLSDPVAALRHAAHLLEPSSGVMIVTVPAFNVAWTHHDVINHHRTRYTKRQIRHEAALAGIDIVEARYWFQWTFPVKVLVRGLEGLGLRGGSPRVPGPLVNRLLYGWSRLEQRWLGPLNPPFGTSLMAVGRAAQTGS